MNKKFSTLLAAFAIIGASASAQTLSTAVAEAESIVAGEFYYLGTKTPAADAKVLTIVKTAANQDSLILKTVADDNAASVLGDSALWTVSSGSTVALGDYFTFTNVLTKQSLKLDKAGNGIISSKADAIDKFGWKWENGTAEALTYIAAGKTFTLTAATTAPIDSLSLTEAATGGVELIPMVPAWRRMTTAELNDINGGSFKWTVAGTTSITEQAKNSAKAFNEYALKAVPVQNMNDTVMYFEKVNSLNASMKGAYLNVDTVYYSRTGSLIDSTKTNGGLIFAFDSLTNATTTATAKAGKLEESFQFVVWTNVKDSMVIEVKNIPAISQSGETFADQATANNGGYVTLVGFDGASKALTASSVSAANVLPSVTLGAGSKAQLAAGAYYIYKQAGDSAYIAPLATTLAGETTTTAVADYVKAWLPSTQWSLDETTNRPAFYNRESGKQFGGSSYLYSTDTEGVYYYGSDTLKIVPVQTEGIYIGYKKMGKTAAEEAVTKLALQFHSVLTEGTTPYVYKATGDSILKVANLDKSDALYFSVLPVDTFKIGKDSLEVVSYKLYNGADTLAYNATRKAYILSENSNTTFIFRETSTQGWYQVLPIASVATGAWTLENAQVSVSGTSAEVIKNDELNKINGYFSLEAPLEPEYATIANVPAHKRIASVENTTLAISMNADSCGVLKAVTELKASEFDKQNFSMYMNVVDKDTVKPLYMISTQQTLALDSAELANDVRFFMHNINAGYATGVDSVGFTKATLANDSLYIGTTKMLAKTANQYTYAFMKTATDGQYYIESQVNGNYLAQVNGVLCAYPTTEQALLFTVNAVAPEDIPTSNEDINASKVSVVAAEGYVTIAGAAGKNVVITNVLGQVIANTVITSDSATIATPAGVVVVAIAGEKAVKAIVK